MMNWLRHLIGPADVEPDDDELPLPPISEGAFEEDSANWHFIQHWLHTELARLHKANEAVSNTESETAAIRGQIRLVKKLLALPKDLQRRRDARAQDESSFND